MNKKTKKEELVNMTLQEQKLALEVKLKQAQSKAYETFWIMTILSCLIFWSAIFWVIVSFVH